MAGLDWGQTKKGLRKVLYSEIGLSKEEQETFFQNMALMISSGVEIKQVLDSLYLDAKSQNLKQKIQDISEAVDRGEPFWRTLQANNILPARLLTIIRIGEESGRLPENLKIVIAQQQNDKIFQSKIRSAMLYPALIFVVLIVVSIVVALFILPNLASVYDRLDTDLPWYTDLIIDGGLFFKENGFKLIPTLIVLQIVAYYILFGNKRTKFLGQYLIFSLPIVKNIIAEIEIGRFTYIAGSMLEAGLPITFVLDSLQNSTEFIVYQKFYKYLAIEVNSGSGLSEAFKSYKHINSIAPVSVRQMISSGEQSGNLAHILLQISKIYEAKNEVSIKNLTTLLEPLLLVIIWVVVAFFALAVVVPIYSLIGNFDAITNNNSL